MMVACKASTAEPPPGWVRFEKLPPSKTDINSVAGISTAAFIVPFPADQSMSKVHNFT